MRSQRLDILDMKCIGLAGIWALYIYYLDDFRWHLLQRALSASFKQYAISGFQQLEHEGDEFALLQHGLTAGNLNQTAAGVESSYLVPHFFGAHLAAALEGVFAVAPHATQIATREPHKYAWQASVR